MVRKQCLGGDKYTKEPFYKMWLSAVAKKKMWLSAQDILYTTAVFSSLKYTVPPGEKYCSTL